MTHREAHGKRDSLALPPADCDGELLERRGLIPRQLLSGHRIYRCRACRTVLGLVGGRIAWSDAPSAVPTQGGGTDDL